MTLKIKSDFSFCFQLKYTKFDFWYGLFTDKRFI